MQQGSPDVPTGWAGCVCVVLGHHRLSAVARLLHGFTKGSSRTFPTGATQTGAKGGRKQF